MHFWNYDEVTEHIVILKMQFSSIMKQRSEEDKVISSKISLKSYFLFGKLFLIFLIVDFISLRSFYWLVIFLCASQAKRKLQTEKEDQSRQFAFINVLHKHQETASVGHFMQSTLSCVYTYESSVENKSRPLFSWKDRWYLIQFPFWFFFQIRIVGIPFSL